MNETQSQSYYNTFLVNEAVKFFLHFLRPKMDHTVPYEYVSVQLWHFCCLQKGRMSFEKCYRTASLLFIEKT